LVDQVGFREARRVADRSVCARAGHANPSPDPVRWVGRPETSECDRNVELLGADVLLSRDLKMEKPRAGV